MKTSIPNYRFTDAGFAANGSIHRTRTANPNCDGCGQPIQAHKAYVRYRWAEPKPHTNRYHPECAYNVGILERFGPVTVGDGTISETVEYVPGGRIRRIQI